MSVMNWDKLLILGGQCVVIVVLGCLVGSGHDGTIQDGLLAVCASVAGIGVYQAFSKPKA